MNKFKPGDLITGKDRSYERSIYKVIKEHEEGGYLCNLVYYRLITGNDTDRYLIDDSNQYKIASYNELNEGFGKALKGRLVLFLRKLMLSSQVLQSLDL